jgi:LacI family transcriptional regulator
MRDVARLSGVSVATVSAVVNASANVSPELKARVADAMAALDYHPDEVARSLKTGRTNVIGVIIPDITNAFYPEVVRGIEEAAREAGYSVVLCDSNEDSVEESKHLSALFSRRVDGVLLACCVNSTAYDTMLSRRYPMVFVDRVPASAGEGTVSTDNVHAGYLAARHLIELGHQRIAMLVGNLGLSPHRDRLEGFRKAMQESHLPILKEYLSCNGIAIENGILAGRDLLDLAVPPTAIMVSNSKLLFGLIQTLDERKVDIPSEVSLVSFDDYIWNRYFSPSLTTVAQMTNEMGRLSFRLLLQIINRRAGDPLAEKHVRLPAELRVRTSTAPPGGTPSSRPAAAKGRNPQPTRAPFRRRRGSRTTPVETPTGLLGT